MKTLPLAQRFRPDLRTTFVVALFFAMLLGGPALAQTPAITRSEIIIYVAGTPGTYNCGGDGGLATSATFYYPFGLAVDAAGDIYISDYQCSTVREISASTGIITVVAGAENVYGYTGDGGLASGALLSSPDGLAFDSVGNLYIADSQNNVVRMVNKSNGMISTVAGNGTAGFAGDGGPATMAQMNYPFGLFVDAIGDLYISDYQNNRIRKVSKNTGIITTVAGNGTAGFSGDGSAATSAKLSGPEGLVLDTAGNLYIADYNNNRIRKVTHSTGIITTNAGDGTASTGGNGGPATSAQINGPDGLGIDSSGNVYVGEQSGSEIREVVESTGLIIPIAGNGTPGYTGNGGVATDSEINSPYALALDSVGNLYLYDGNNTVVRKVNPSGGTLLFPDTPVLSTSVTETLILLVHQSGTTISSIAAQPAQNGSSEYSLASDTCSLNTPIAAGTVCTLSLTFSPGYAGPRPTPLVLTSSAGTFTFGMLGVGTEPAVALTPGTISTIAGTGTAGYSGDGGAALGARLSAPSFAAMDAAGKLYFSDSANHRIRQVNTVTHRITTVAGNGAAGYSGDGGVPVSAALDVPAGLTLDAAGNLYLADEANHTVREINASTGLITTVAGNGTAGYSGDGGLAVSALLQGPSAVAVDISGNLYISDTGNNVIREVNGNGIISTVAGTGLAGFSGDGGVATAAALSSPVGLVADSGGHLYVSDSGNNRLRAFSVGGLINTVAGNGSSGYSGDGGLATSAELNQPRGLKIDQGGDLFFSDYGNQRLRKVEASSGLITTVAGTGTAGNSGDNGPATSAALNNAQDLALDGAGNLYIPDDANNVVRAVNVKAGSLGFAGSQLGLTSDSPETATVSNIGNAVLTFSVPSTGFNPSLPANFAYAGSSTCPQLTTSSSPATLAAGASCSLMVNFSPTTVGSLSAPAIITDNELNRSSSTQQLTLIGIGLPVASSTTVTAATTVYGQTNVAATVTDAGMLLPGGSILFSVDGIAQGAAALNGAAVATMPAVASHAVSAGVHSVTAAYTSSSPDLGNSTGSASVTVAQATPVVTFSSSPAVPAYGQAVTITVNVTAAGVPQPGSTVVVSVGGQMYSCVTNSAGQCVVTVPGGVLATGNDAASASTTATTNAVAGSGAAALAVGKAATTVAMTTSAGSVDQGYPVTLTASVLPATSGVPTGVVTFSAGGTSLGSGMLMNGVATLTTGVPTPGADSIVASYGGDSNFTSSSTNLIETVLPASFTISSSGVGSTPSQTVMPGGTASFPISLGVVDGFRGSLTMSATGLPPGATASFNPAVVVLNGSGVGATTLSVTTVVPTTSSAAGRIPPSNANPYPGSMGIGVRLGLVLLPLLARRRLRGQPHRLPSRLATAMFMLLVLGSMGATLTGCAGGYLGTSSKSYVVTVVATSGAQQASTTVTLQIQ